MKYGETEGKANLKEPFTPPKNDHTCPHADEHSVNFVNQQNICGIYQQNNAAAFF